MKKFVVISALSLVLVGCNFLENGNNQRNEGFVQTIPQSEQSSIQKVGENMNWQTYQNSNLGILFRYPGTLGKAWENNNYTETVSLKFMDDKGNPADLELTGADYGTLRTCDDILSKGFNGGDRMPSECETLIVDNHTVVLLTFGQSRFGISSKSAHFQTKKGVWEFSATNKNLYDVLIDIVRTLKYLN